MNRIKDLRLARGMQQEDLARLLSVTRVSISRYETGVHSIDAETICRLCDIFGCTADYLLGRSSRPDPDLSPEEEQLLAAYANASDEIRENIDHMLERYKKGDTASAPTA
ncbi:MAG: helix-turn-helix transcriptional regulator [Oscillospiraceae bacterium]|nr:helix-turn-helix transcriptional regulator [Oscillospiraceae bacterium]